MNLVLTEEEVAVLRLSISGMKSSEIAIFTGMSTHGVDGLLLAIFQKLSGRATKTSTSRHVLKVC